LPCHSGDIVSYLLEWLLWEKKDEMWRYRNTWSLLGRIQNNAVVMESILNFPKKLKINLTY
jgi:hypothetical protein